MEATNGNLYPGLAERPGNVEGTRVLVRLDADESDQSEIAVAPKTGKKRGYVDVGIRLIDHRNVDGDLRPKNMSFGAIRSNTVDGRERI